jgi:hypothetical protein
MIKHLSKEQLIQLGLDYLKKYDMQPSGKTWSVKNGGCSKDRIYEVFGSWPNYIKELSNLDSTVKQTFTNKSWTKETIIESLKSYYSIYGKSPTSKSIKKSNGQFPSINTATDFFGSWNNALMAANLPINTLHGFHTKNSIIESILDYIATTGEIPGNRDLSISTTASTLFGSWNAAIEAAGFEPNIQNGFGIDTYGLDGHLYRSKSEAYFVDNFLFNKYEYIVEPKYPKPYNKYYDWYIPSIALYIELDGGIRPETTKDKIAINKILTRNCLFIDTSSIYKASSLLDFIKNIPPEGNS